MIFYIESEYSETYVKIFHSDEDFKSDSGKIQMFKENYHKN